ncbi:MAG: RluA family pseudouridine synthase [Aquabacterium sp.]
MSKRSQEPAMELESDESDVLDDSWSDAPQVWPVKEAVVDARARGQRLDQFLVGMAPDFSRSYLKTLVESGLVSINGQQVDSASRKVAPGQVIVIQIKPTPQSQAFAPEKMDLPIVFEDEHLLVVNKLPGMVVHPAAGNWTGTLMNGLLAHHAGAMDLPRAGIVHRLDKDTSGLMVVGKTIPAVTALSRAIAAREVSRQYLALVHGAPPASFKVDAPIGRDPVTRVKMAVLASGKEARTDVRTLMSAELLEGRVVSAVHCTLHTGRTHQIRVHLSSRKHPLVADAMYGGAPALDMTRQALHAARLSLTHPATGVEMVWEAPLPPDMDQAWTKLSELPQLAIRGA